jgi:signal transduction histidine kinase
MLYLLERFGTAYAAIAYLGIGGASLYWYAVTGMEQLSVSLPTDSFLLTLPKLALVFVGAGGRVLPKIVWALAGAIVAEGVVAAAAIQTGAERELGSSTLAALLVIVVAMIILASSRRVAANAQPTLLRAARDEQLSVLRYRIEVKAAAIMHDTVLNHLAAIASAPIGPLRPELGTQMARDLEVLVGEEWLLDSDLPDTQAGMEWRSSALFAAIGEARDLGLDVEVSGDVSAIGRLDAPRALAVALAAKQCLVNVIRHSGVTTAEVVVYGSETELSIMIIDAGRGFAESETARDRLGLRNSVRERIAAVSGSVQVWSTPGRGTSVMIRVPANSTDAALETEAHS